MHAQTLQLFEQYQQRLAELNGISVGTVQRGAQFTVAPEVDQRMRDAIRQSDAFLRLITYVQRDNQSGEVIDVGTSTTIAGRTDTSGGAERVPADPVGLAKDTYTAKQTNFDVKLGYDTLDAWRHDPNFQNLWSQAVTQQMGLDTLMIGWNGTSAAATTNRVTNSMLQDVNIGWLQKMRTGNAARWIAEGAATNEIRVGTAAGADFRNLDELVMDLTKLVHDRYHEDPRMRVMLGRNLITDKYMTFQGDSSTDAPTEQEALEKMKLNKRLGGFPAIVVPFIPARTLLLTIPANLQIIEQTGTRRRMIRDHAPGNAVQDFNSVNQAFGIGRFEAAVGCENITYAEEGTWTSGG